MADIILIQPSIKEFQIMEKTPTLPLSLLSIASPLDGEYDVKIIDQRLNKYWEKELEKELEKQPICVGITVMTCKQIINALKASKIVRNSPNLTKVVWGGAHPSLLPKQTLENQNIDIVVRGEGELSFYELVKALDRNKSLDGIKGISYKRNKKIVNNPDRPFLDLNRLPALPYHIIKIKNYTPRRNGKKSIYIETSRGCLNNCAYCYNIPINGCVYRCLDIKTTIEKIDWLVKNYGIEYFWIVDDNYFTNKKRAIEISKQIIRDKLMIEWTAVGADINVISRFSISELKILKQSGCAQLFFGVESGSKRILRLINKCIIPEQVVSLNRLLKKIGIKPKYFLMYGAPTETLGELKKTVDLALTLLKDNNSASIDTFCYTPVPSTALFNLALKEGFIPPKSLMEWAAYDRSVMYNNLNSEKSGALIENLNFISKFFMGNSHGRKELDLIRRVHLPIARVRMKNLFFNYFFEKKVYDLIIKMKRWT